MKAGNMLAILGCAWPSGLSPCANVIPIWVFVLPSNSFTSSVVEEYCEAFTSPTLLRYAPLLRKPVMKTLSNPTALAAEETKLYQGMPEKSWPVLAAVAGFGELAGTE